MIRIGAISPVDPKAVADAAKSVHSGAAKAADDASKIAKVARDFEAIFVRQLLETAKVAGDAKGYGSLGVNALADSMVEGGGLGMAASLERSLQSHVAPHAPASVQPLALAPKGVSIAAPVMHPLMVAPDAALRTKK